MLPYQKKLKDKKKRDSVATSTTLPYNTKRDQKNKNNKNETKDERLNLRQKNLKVKKQMLHFK